jgi:ABC-type Fe3+/spermidine/putrescine transport system ATPase subunit
VFDPPVLLMDEPLSALDRRLRQAMQFELRHLQAKLETTVIYVTHDQEEALVLSDRIGVMRAGVFQQIGPPSVVYEEPANAFVSSFLGESNRLLVTVVEQSGDRVVVRPRRTSHPLLRAVGTTGTPAAGEAVLVLRPERVRLRDGSELGRRELSGDDHGCRFPRRPP